MTEEEVAQLGVEGICTEIGLFMARAATTRGRQSEAVPRRAQRLARVLVHAKVENRGELVVHAVHAIAQIFRALHPTVSTEEAPLLTDLANILDAVHDAATCGDPDGLNGAAKWARARTRERENSPSAKTPAVPTPQLLAKLMEAAIAPSRERIAAPTTGLHGIEPQPRTRWEVAECLARHLQVLYPEWMYGDLTEAVYARMALEKTAHGVDRTRQYRNHRFKADARRTIVAAFKAAGYPTDSAEDLFDGDAQREKRAKKREAATCASTDKVILSVEDRGTSDSLSNSTVDGEATTRTETAPRGNGTTPGAARRRAPRRSKR